MIKAAITGNIAAGKTQVENILKKEGFKVLDTDNVTHYLLKTQEIKTKLLKLFGDEIFENNEISRKKLANIVFNDDAAKKQLEKIIHPEVKKEILKFYEESSSEKIVFVSVPQLFEADMQKLFDKIILIIADDKLRLERLQKRNGYDLETAQKRLSSQISQYSKQALSDFVVNNNDTIIELNKNVKNIIMRLLR